MGKPLRRSIAALQIVGAVLVVYSLSGEMAQRFSHRDFPVAVEYLIALFLFAACALAISAGVLLWRDRPSGYGLSIVVQALQVPLLMSSFLNFSLMLGLGLWFYVSRSDGSWGVEAKFRFGETYRFSVASAGGSFEIGVNLVACYFIYLLWRAVARSAPGSGDHSADPSSP
jgi:hypothetical protein